MHASLEKIIRKTGRKPISCKCSLCQRQCTQAPCLGTPADIEKIIDAGYASRIYSTSWAAGMLMGICDQVIYMYQAEFVNNQACTFFKNGLCELHDKGLKPTEGKLSHHTTKSDNFKRGKSVTWHVAKEWLDPANYETIARIQEKMKLAAPQNL